MVDCPDVSKETPVVCFVLETATVVERLVELTVWGLLVAPEVVWTTEVPVTPMVGISEVVVARIDVD